MKNNFFTRGASVVAKSILLKLLENGKMSTKRVSRPLIVSRGLAFDEKYFLCQDAPRSVMAESNLCELLENGNFRQNMSTDLL
jgi:hypothetical protein